MANANGFMLDSPSLVIDVIDTVAEIGDPNNRTFTVSVLEVLPTLGL
jgi:hypothetical protein